MIKQLYDNAKRSKASNKDSLSQYTESDLLKLRDETHDVA